MENQLVEEFYSNKSMKEIANNYGTSIRIVRKLWAQTYEASDILHRKKRIRSIIGRDGSNVWKSIKPNVVDRIVEKFYTNDTMSSISNNFGISISFIRKAWRGAFGSRAVCERAKKQISLVGSRRKSTLSLDTKLKIVYLLKSGYKTIDVAKAFDVSISTVRNVAKSDHATHEIVCAAADDKRRIGRCRRWERDRISKQQRQDKIGRASCRERV